MPSSSRTRLAGLSAIQFLVVIAGTLVAALIWTAPNVALCFYVMTHLAVLWSIPANHTAIIQIVVKTCSPLLVAALLWACGWLYTQVRVGRPVRQQPPPGPQVKPPGTTAPLRGYAVFPPAAPILAPNEAGPQEQPFAAIHSLEGAASPGIQRALPITPLPGELAPEPVESEAAAPLSEQPALPELAQALQDQPGAHVAVTRAPGERQGDVPPQRVLLELRLLGSLTMTFLSPEGTQFPVTMQCNPRETQFLAYIASRQGAKVDLDNLREHVFGFGLSDEEASTEQLQKALSSTKKTLRRKLDAAIRQVNQAAGSPFIPSDFEPFCLGNEQYWLSPACRVTDLARLEELYQTIGAASGEDVLAAPVQHACQELLELYTGDLLEDEVKAIIRLHEEWEEHWMQRPYTQYRDWYLRALWYRAEYYRHVGERQAEGTRQRDAFEEAARLYLHYAQHACNSRFDRRVRRSSADQALRYCLRMYARTGNTHAALLACQAFKETVDDVFPEWNWRMPDKTRRVWEQIQSITREHVPLTVSPPPVEGEE